MAHIHILFAGPQRPAQELARQLRQNRPDVEVQLGECAPGDGCRATLLLGALPPEGFRGPILSVEPDAQEEGSWVWDGGRGDARALHRAVEAKVLDLQLDRFQVGAAARAQISGRLERALAKLVSPVVPQAQVSTRVKSASSFAEKVVRRAGDHADPATQFRDLVGARITVQTTNQIAALGAAVRAAFDVVEDDDKTGRLSDSEFGYRGLHLGVKFDGTICEVQIRTALQHAWADIVHDRLYKSSIEPDHDERRAASVLAALLEEGDRLAQALADSIDDRAQRFGRSQSRESVAAEIDRLELLVALDPADFDRLLALAHLRADMGELEDAARVLEPALRLRRRADLSWFGARSDCGHYLVQLHWDHPQSLGFRTGRQLLHSTRLSLRKLAPEVHGTELQVLQARNWSRMAWALSQSAPPGQEGVALRTRARELMAQALTAEPADPYLMADTIAMTCAASGYSGLGPLTRDRAQAALAACAGHASDGLQMPKAAFTAARFSLLLGDRLAALTWYAVALSHIAEGVNCVGHLPIRGEVDWLDRMSAWSTGERDLTWARSLLALAQRAAAAAGAGLFVVGGEMQFADSARAGHLQRCPQTADGQYSADTITAAIAEWSAFLAAPSPPEPGRGGYFYGRATTCPVHALVASALGLRVLVETPAEPGVTMINQPHQSRWVPVPADDVVRDQTLAMAMGRTSGVAEQWVEKMAQQIHEFFRGATLREAEVGLAENALPWEHLADEFRKSNADQARQIAQNLASLGYSLAPSRDPRPVEPVTPDLVEQLAVIEHGRWAADKLSRGFRWGPRKQGLDHPDLVGWDKLKEASKAKDLEAVRNWPQVLENVGLKIVRAGS